MERTKIFLLMLVVASAGLASSLVMLTATIQKRENVLQILLELIEGREPPGVPFFVPISTLLFFSTVLASTVGAIYFLIIPEIKNRQLPPSNGTGDFYKTLLEILLPDERKVVETLIKHEGIYLQKYITKEADLSRLKTHRAVARLAERGIVTIEKKGNTNLVKLMYWPIAEERRQPASLAQSL